MKLAVVARTFYAMTLPWILFAAAVFFGVLAYDAARLSTPAKDVPYALTAKGWGEDIAHVSLAEQERRKRYNLRDGLGDLSQSAWLFSILCVAFLIGACCALVF